MPKVHQQLHQRQVPADRKQSGGQIELEEAAESWPGALPPGEAFMPEEIVDDGGLDRQRRGHQIVEVQSCLQPSQGEQLHGNPDSAYEIELEPANRGGTPAAAASSDALLRIQAARIADVKKISIAVMPAMPTAPPTSNRR